MLADTRTTCYLMAGLSKPIRLCQREKRTSDDYSEVGIHDYYRDLSCPNIGEKRVPTIITQFPNTDSFFLQFFC